MSIESYPLSWPDGWPRTKHPKPSMFSVGMATARDGLLEEIRLLGGRGIIISTNIKTYMRGGQEIPYANQGRPDDCGVAVYFTLKNEQRVFACDRWKSVQENIRAISLTIGALRGIERWGSSEMLNRVFTGFAALPETTATAWWDVLGYDSPNHSLADFEAAYRQKAKSAHPDAGGSNEAMARLNGAIQQAREGAR